MNRSIGVRAQSACFTLGSSGRCGWAKAQWPAYGAPAAIQRFNTDFCAALNGFFNEGGGIISSGSSDRMRCINSLSTSLPGARISKAASRSSSRSLALRVLASGPWQVKQCVAKNRPHLAIKVRRVLGHASDCQKQQGAHPDEWPHAIISFTTSPPTSVRRKSRPLWR